MKKKLTSILLASALTAALLAGCGGSTAPASQEAKEETAAEEAASPEETPAAEVGEAEAPETGAPEAEAPEAEAAMTDEEAAADAAAKIDAIYVQARTETTDADIRAARDAWNALTDAQKEKALRMFNPFEQHQVQRGYSPLSGLLNNAIQSRGVPF